MLTDIRLIELDYTVDSYKFAFIHTEHDKQCTKNLKHIFYAKFVFDLIFKVDKSAMMLIIMQADSNQMSTM